MLLVVPLFYLGLAPLGYAAEPALPTELFEQSSSIPILNAEVFEDPGHVIDWQSLTDLERLGKVVWEPTTQFNYGYTRSRYWFKFPVQNRDPSQVQWIFELGYPLIQEVSVHIVGTHGIITSSKTGRFVPFQKRELEYRTFLFPFHLDRGSQATIYVSLETGGTLRAPFRIHSEKSLIPTSEQQSLWLGIYYGAIGALVLYNLFIFFALRDRIYLYYVLYASSFAALQGALSGHAYQYLWPAQVFWNRISIPFLVGFSFFFLAVFTRALLDTKRTTPKSNHLLTVLGALSIVLMALSFGDYGMTPNKFASVMVSYAPLLVIPSVSICIRMGSKPAVFYAVAFVSFFIGSEAVASKDLGLLPMNFITLYGMHLGSAIEALLFSLALAYRVRILREEKLLTELQIAATKQQLTESKLQLSDERAISQFASQVAHDIRSPLAALKVLEGDLFGLPEDKRLMIRSAVHRIKNIADNLLEKNRVRLRKMDPASVAPETHFPIEVKSVQLISSLVDQLITEKCIQYRSKIGIEIEAHLTASSYGLFALIQPDEFKRVLSNLINNAVEALVETGRVNVRLLNSSITDAGFGIRIEIQDNGKGIPKEILPKLMQQGETYGKEGGLGFGLFHARTTLESWQGSLTLLSDLGLGTTAVISIPRAVSPAWFVPALELPGDCTVVVLDDDRSIHQVWQSRFDSLENGLSISVVHLSSQFEFEKWVARSSKSCETIIYLCDYELSGEKSGLDLIETLGIQKSAVLVTSRYEEIDIRTRCVSMGVRLIPKGQAGLVPISLGNSEKC